jgi:hypothetical protein
MFNFKTAIFFFFVISSFFFSSAFGQGRTDPRQSGFCVDTSPRGECQDVAEVTPPVKRILGGMVDRLPPRPECVYEFDIRPTLATTQVVVKCGDRSTTAFEGGGGKVDIFSEGSGVFLEFKGKKFKFNYLEFVFEEVTQHLAVKP